MCQHYSLTVSACPDFHSHSWSRCPIDAFYVFNMCSDKFQAPAQKTLDSIIKKSNYTTFPARSRLIYRNNLHIFSHFAALREHLYHIPSGSLSTQFARANDGLFLFYFPKNSTPSTKAHNASPEVTLGGITRSLYTHLASPGADGGWLVFTRQLVLPGPPTRRWTRGFRTRSGPTHL